MSMWNAKAWFRRSTPPSFFFPSMHGEPRQSELKQLPDPTLCSILGNAGESAYGEWCLYTLCICQDGAHQFVHLIENTSLLQRSDFHNHSWATLWGFSVSICMLYVEYICFLKHTLISHPHTCNVPVTQKENIFPSWLLHAIYNFHSDASSLSAVMFVSVGAMQRSAVQKYSMVMISYRRSSSLAAIIISTGLSPDPHQLGKLAFWESTAARFHTD